MVEWLTSHITTNLLTLPHHFPVRRRRKAGEAFELVRKVVNAAVTELKGNVGKRKGRVLHQRLGLFGAPPDQVPLQRDAFRGRKRVLTAW
jgi:hypothetical protein